jgi:hypothetical protein
MSNLDDNDLATRVIHAVNHPVVALPNAQLFVAGELFAPGGSRLTGKTANLGDNQLPNLTSTGLRATLLRTV